jgi:hypothetical protein
MSGKSNIKSKLANLFPGESFLPGLQMTAFQLGPHLVESSSSGLSLLTEHQLLSNQSPTLMTSFNLCHLFANPISEYCHFGG